MTFFSFQTKESVTTNLPALSAIKIAPEFTASEENKGITMLKLFINSAGETNQENDKYR